MLVHFFFQVFIYKHTHTKSKLLIRLIHVAPETIEDVDGALCGLSEVEGKLIVTGDTMHF